MTSKASDLAARLAATAAGARPNPPAAVPAQRKSDPESSERQASQIQRFTMNLSKAQHRFIRQFALANESEVSTIIRLLLGRIESDPVFAEDVRSMLHEVK